MSLLTPQAAKRGGQAMKAQAAVHMIEGESVTFGQIAARLGVSLRTARHRFFQERAKPGPITWEGLGR